MKSSVVRVFIIISCLVSMILGFSYMYYFRISSIKTNEPISTDYKSTLLKYTLPLLNSETVKKELMRQNPLIADVIVKKKYPNELVITVKKTKPVAQLKNGTSYIDLDPLARVLSEGNKENKKYMQISFYQTLPDYELKKGQTLKRKEILYALTLMSKIDIENFHLKKLIVSAPSVLTLQGDENEPTVLVSTKKDIDKNLTLLHNSIKALIINGEHARIINLQFSKPYVEYENNSGN